MVLNRRPLEKNPRNKHCYTNPVLNPRSHSSLLAFENIRYPLQYAEFNKLSSI